MNPESSTRRSGPQLTHRYTRAVDCARLLHAVDVRKGTTVPYLSHLLSVSAIVLEHGGTEDQAIAALLHDAAEDHGGEARLVAIEAEFGAAVATIVRACSDSLTVDASAKAPWRARKVAYLMQLEGESSDAALVSASDKLHNARAILSDYRAMGEALWGKFNADAGRAGTLWYYRRLVEIFRVSLGADSSLVGELDDTVARLMALVAKAHPEVDLAPEHEERCREETALRSTINQGASG